MLSPYLWLGDEDKNLTNSLGDKALRSPSRKSQRLFISLASVSSCVDWGLCSTCFQEISVYIRYFRMRFSLKECLPNSHWCLFQKASFLPTAPQTNRKIKEKPKTKSNRNHFTDQDGASGFSQSTSLPLRKCCMRVRSCRWVRLPETSA